jgi:hypothetical protein
LSFNWSRSIIFQKDEITVHQAPLLFLTLIARHVSTVFSLCQIATVYVSTCRLFNPMILPPKK